jgi:ABC-type dipeptide/oligopeptide/nickel transport system permease subunit
MEGRELVATEHEDWRNTSRKALATVRFLAGALITRYSSSRCRAVSFVWTPYDVTKLVIADRLQTPNAAHWLGTDHFGRDILSMIMVGSAQFHRRGADRRRHRYGRRRAARLLGGGKTRRRSTRS